MGAIYKNRNNVTVLSLVTRSVAWYSGINDVSRYIRVYRRIGKYLGVPPAGLLTSDCDS